MAFERPPLSALLLRVQNDIETELPGENARLRRRAPYAFARAMAGASHGMHGRLSFAIKQSFPDTAESEFLDQWAGIWLEGGRKLAVKASGGGVEATGTESTVIPSGTIWQRVNPDGDPDRYIQSNTPTITGGVATCLLTAETAGAAANAEAGETFELANPVAGVDPEADVMGATAETTDGIQSGADEESDEDLVERLLLRIQVPPAGGGPGDFVREALDQPGVTRAWEFGNRSGNATVDVLFVCDDQPGSPIPGASKIAAVQAAQDAFAPIWMIAVFVTAPDAAPLDVTITSLTPDTADVRAAITAELQDLVIREGEPGKTLALSKIREAISRAPGEEDHIMTVPAADVTHLPDELVTLGTITFP